MKATIIIERDDGPPLTATAALVRTGNKNPETIADHANVLEVTVNGQMFEFSGTARFDSPQWNENLFLPAWGHELWGNDRMGAFISRRFKDRFYILDLAAMSDYEREKEKGMGPKRWTRVTEKLCDLYLSHRMRISPETRRELARRIAAGEI